MLVSFSIFGLYRVNRPYPLTSGNTRVPTRTLIVIIHLCLFQLLDQTSPAVCVSVCHLHSRRHMTRHQCLFLSLSRRRASGKASCRMKWGRTVKEENRRENKLFFSAPGHAVARRVCQMDPSGRSVLCRWFKPL